MYSTHNEGKSVVAERSIKTMKDEKMTANDIILTWLFL